MSSTPSPPKASASASASTCDQTRPPCRFYPLGTCKFGSSCTFSHSANVRPLCQFYKAGSCRYGSSCLLRHQQDSRRPLPGNGQSTTEGDEKAPGDEPCGICYESIPMTGRRFGLLTGCDHLFCLDCVKNWRQSKSVNKDVSRSCPICRKRSHFIVPSKYAVRGEEKALLIDTYKERLSQQPCRYYEAGRCPFGSKCFYAHIRKDGEESSVYAPTMEQLFGMDIAHISALVHQILVVEVAEF